MAMVHVKFYLSPTHLTWISPSLYNVWRVSTKSSIRISEIQTQVFYAAMCMKTHSDHSLYLSSDDMMMSCSEQKQEQLSFKFSISNKVYQQPFNKQQLKNSRSDFRITNKIRKNWLMRTQNLGITHLLSWNGSIIEFLLKSTITLLKEIKFL